MSQLITNIPAKKVWVRKEYLRDLQDGYGEFVEGVWVTAKSLPGRSFYFETYLPYEKYPELLEVDFEKESLYFVLEQQYNCRVTRAVREIEATLVNPLETGYLGLRKGSAICMVKTLAYAGGGHPIEYSIARYRGDRNKFTVELVRSKEDK